MVLSLYSEAGQNHHVVVQNLSQYHDFSGLNNVVYDGITLILKMARLSTMVTSAILTGYLLEDLTVKKVAVLSNSVKDSNLMSKVCRAIGRLFAIVHIPLFQNLHLQ